MEAAVAVVDTIGQRYEVLRPYLNELQRRLFLGGEARVLGEGGVRMVAQATGVSATVVRRGRDELEAGGCDVPVPGRSRRPGGGRKRAEEHDEELIVALDALIEPTTRGDPMSSLRWTTLSTRKLAAVLREQGHQVSDCVVRRLLKQAGYSLQANSKQVEGGSHPDRDAQFGYLNARVVEHQATGDPVISVDTKKKELVGDFKNAGREWGPAGDPERVRVHDFKDPVLGKANPYGVYDITADAGWVSVGTDHDTAAFAVNTIRTWWTRRGQATYPGASRLLITVCHLPPGTSKWNKIEHRLFSHISMNCRGRPLTSHDVIVNTIAATTTSSGLSVHAELDTHDYPTGITIPDQTMKELATNGTWTPHDWHGEWNYTLNPDTPKPD